MEYTFDQKKKKKKRIMRETNLFVIFIAIVSHLSNIIREHNDTDIEQCRAKTEVP